MRHILLICIFTLSLFSAQLIEKNWKKGESFSMYLAKNGIPPTLLRSIAKDDMTLLSEIQSDENFCELIDNDILEQALIPLGEEMQIHLYRDFVHHQYHFDIIPISTKTIKDTVYFKIENSFFEDIQKNTNNPRLGFLLKRYYGQSINFKTLQKGDRIAFIYSQKNRLGKPYGKATISTSLIQNHKKNHFIFRDKKGVYYDNTNKDISYTSKKKYLVKSAKYFVNPVGNMRITSKFTYKRWHPILHRYRPHLGIDIGAKRGVKIYAVNDGKVIFAGRLGGYGNAVKISHADGYMSLYAHQSKLAVKKGQFVKAKQVIGYIGSTGRSTGPHLHFGLYKNHKPVDPQKYLKIKSIGSTMLKNKIITKHKIVPIKNAKRNRAKIFKAIAKKQKAYLWDTYSRPYDMINDRSKYEK